MIDSQYTHHYSPLVFGDADHDGDIEMYRGIYNIQADSGLIRIYEFDDNLTYEITDLPFYGLPWAIGDIDGNGKTDLVIQTGDP